MYLLMILLKFPPKVFQRGLYIIIVCREEQITLGDHHLLEKTPCMQWFIKMIAYNYVNEPTEKGC